MDKNIADVHIKMAKTTAQQETGQHVSINGLWTIKIFFDVD